MSPELAEEFRRIGMTGFRRGWTGCAEMLVEPEMVAVAVRAYRDGASVEDLLGALSGALIELGKRHG